jgi:hypothetical protein
MKKRREMGDIFRLGELCNNFCKFFRTDLYYLISSFNQQSFTFSNKHYYLHCNHSTNENERISVFYSLKSILIIFFYLFHETFQASFDLYLKKEQQ